MYDIVSEKITVYLTMEDVKSFREGEVVLSRPESAAIRLEKSMDECEWALFNTAVQIELTNILDVVEKRELNSLPIAPNDPKLFFRIQRFY